MTSVVVVPVWRQTTAAWSSSRHRAASASCSPWISTVSMCTSRTRRALHRDDLAVLVVVVQEAEPGAAQVQYAVDGLAHVHVHVDLVGWDRGWRRALG